MTPVARGEKGRREDGGEDGAKTTALVSQVADHTRFISVTARVSMRRNLTPNQNMGQSAPRPPRPRRSAGEAAATPPLASTAKAKASQR
jgi:hypothetical protein